jgi:hypothetical protein
VGVSVGKIYILDEIQPKPGGVEAYRHAYLAEYAPGARARGMTLEAVRMSPPVELPEGGNRLVFLWSVPDVQGWWRMRIGSDAEKGAWWARSAELAVSRARRYLTDLDHE